MMFLLILGLCYLLVLVLFTLIRLKASEENVEIESGLSIIISFRNEALRFSALFKSLENSFLVDRYRIEILFVDDHSTDDSALMVSDFIEKNKMILSCKLLINEQIGKKSAIEFGVKHSTFERILCLDADVSFNPRFLEHALKRNFKDSLILGRIELLEERNLISNISRIENYLLQFLTEKSVILQKPLMANGASLGFEKSFFLKANPYSSNKEIKSGDDIFLLEAAKKQGLRFQYHGNAANTVYTKAPINLNELLSQKLRWARKTKSVINVYSALFTLLFLGKTSLLVFGMIQNSMFLILFYLIIIIQEWGILMSSRAGLNKKTITLFDICFLICYPFFGIFIGILAILPFQIEWKSRKMIS